MKPNWKDAPDWAQYLAQGPTGAWFWFSVKPFNNGRYWEPLEGKSQIVESVRYWGETLEERPE